MFMDFDSKFIVAVLAVVAAAVLVYPFMVQEPEGPGPVQFKEIPRFESYEALKAAFEEGMSGRNYGIMEAVVGLPSAMPMAAKAGDSVSQADYSTTNIQVEGVDEADIVKTDGKYVYSFSKNRLVITEAYPVETGRVVSKTELDGIYPQEMFVSGNNLLLFGKASFDYMEEPGGQASEMGIAPYPYWGGGTVVRLYDISDRENIVLEKEISFEGNYLTSRLIGEKAYFVVNSWPRYGVMEEDGGNIIPLMREDSIEKMVAEPTDIGYILPMPAQSFVTLVSLDLGSGETGKETIAGSAYNVFASKDAIYLAATVWLPRDSLIPEGTPVVKDVERAIIGDEEKTVVNKFGLDNGRIGFLGQGEVPGHVLNQFSMDEFEGNFRIATTIGWNGSNSLYVLDSEMDTIGVLEDLAPGESIYSARFMGNKAYLVTFRKIDPLFVIDLSNPRSPRVLGKLKIPGYSDYLHPIDESHLIGIGKETIEAAKGDFAWYQGLKMAVFDVSDVENPVEMHKIVIGDRGTESYALHDHKAFLYDKEKELLVLPIMLAEIPEEQKKPLGENQISPSYGQPVFQGAFVFKLNLEDGFVERGRITHVSEEDELKRGYYYGDDYSVKRALYIGNVLYTLSENMLKANDLGSLQDLKEFAFG